VQQLGVAAVEAATLVESLQYATLRGSRVRSPTWLPWRVENLYSRPWCACEPSVRPQWFVAEPQLGAPI